MPVLDIIGETCLNTIHELGYKSAVIAGGMVRDSVLEGDWKDIDIFLPIDKTNPDKILIDISGQSDFKVENITMGNSISRNYRNVNLISVIDLIYMGGIKVQIMPYDLPNDDMFKFNLINDFNYGIDQAVYDGKEIHLSDSFMEDKKRNTATLLKLKSLADLPHAMDKFNRIKQKYPGIKFACPLLSIKKEKKKKETRPVVELSELPVTEVVHEAAQTVADTVTARQWWDELPRTDNILGQWNTVVTGLRR